MITVGFFWNVAAIATTGTLCSTPRAPAGRRPSRRRSVRGEELQPVHLRPAHADRHVEVVFLVDPFGERLVEAAVLGLREPVGREHDAVGRLRVGERAERGGGERGEGAERAWHGASCDAGAGDDATADIRSENGQSPGDAPRKMPP
jgi:hypothetical protein